ncbi:MAG: hypothetical protein ABIK28_16640 [Planctomycetota bacterium]
MIRFFGKTSFAPLLLLLHVLLGGFGWAQEGELAIQVLETEKTLRLDGLWPGFAPLDVAVALFDGEKTVLARHPNPPEEFSPMPGHDGFYFCKGRHPQVVANSTAMIGDRRTATVLLNMNSDPSLEALAGIVVHESFHVFQWLGHDDWMANEAVTFTYPVEDVQGLVYRRLEAQALNKALGSTSDELALAWAKGAMEMREKRFSRLSEDQRAYDRSLERLEGSAFFLEDQCQGKKPSRLAEEMEANDIRKRNYATGQALCFLLDRFHPQWKERLEKGPKADLDVMLKEVLDKNEIKPCMPDPALVSEMERKAKDDVEKVIAARNEEKQAFMEAQGWTLVIQVRNPENLFWPSGFDPMNVIRLNEHEILHTRMLQLSGQAGSFDAMNLKTLTLAKGPHPLYNGVTRITVTGMAEEPEINEVEGKVTVTAKDLKVTLTGAKIEKSKNMVSLYI